MVSKKWGLALNLCLILVTSALVSCGKNNRIPGFHPIFGDYPKLLTGVAYDVDESKSYDVTFTKTLIQGAQALADANNETYDDPMVSDPDNTPVEWLIGRYDKFHYWPNILNLTEIYHQDMSLYTLIRNEILALDPNAAALASQPIPPSSRASECSWPAISSTMSSFSADPFRSALRLPVQSRQP